MILKPSILPIAGKPREWLVQALPSTLFDVRKKQGRPEPAALYECSRFSRSRNRQIILIADRAANAARIRLVFTHDLSIGHRHQFFIRAVLGDGRSGHVVGVPGIDRIGNELDVSIRKREVDAPRMAARYALAFAIGVGRRGYRSYPDHRNEGVGGL